MPEWFVNMNGTTVSGPANGYASLSLRTDMKVGEPLTVVAKSLMRPAVRRLAQWRLLIEGWEPRPAFQPSLVRFCQDILQPLGKGRTSQRGPTKASGRAAVESVLKAIDLALKGEIDAIVTAPISKEAVKMAGYPWPGHTEILAERTGTKQPVMTMVGGGLIVPLVTTHVSMADLPKRITRERVLRAIRVIAESLPKYWGIRRPRIAVCGLNPHAGEAGQFGREEIEAIAPAIRLAQKAGVSCSGPLPADVVFYQARRGLYDAVVAMYHDQANIPVKMLAFDSGVNVTLGLPIIRTSPDHGTAFDIASKGIANPGSMIAAIKMAVAMVAKRGFRVRGSGFR